MTDQPADQQEQPFDEWLTELGNTQMHFWRGADKRRCYQEMRRLQAENEGRGDRLLGLSDEIRRLDEKLASSQAENASLRARVEEYERAEQRRVGDLSKYGDVRGMR